MNRVSFSFTYLFFAAIFTAVLFADLLPLPVGSYEFQRFLLVILLAVITCVTMALQVHRHGPQLLKVLWPGLLVALSFIGLAVPYRESAFTWVEPGLFATFFLGSMALGSLVSERNYNQQLVIALVYTASAGVALYGAVSVMVYLFALSDQKNNLVAYIPWGFVNIRYWSHIATWLMPLLALSVLIGPFRHHGIWRFVCAMGAALWWWILFLSTSRGSLVGLFFGALMVGVVVGRPALPWFKVCLRYLGYGAFAWLMLSVVIPSVLLGEISLRTLHAGSSGRLVLFIEAWRMSLENFPFGMGPQSWLTHETLTEQYLKSKQFGHPHNMYLMWAAEYGWVIIVMLAVLATKAARLLWLQRLKVRSLNRGEHGLVLAAFSASVFAALAHAAVSSVFIAPGSMLIGFLVLCVFWGLVSQPAERVCAGWGSGRWLVSSMTLVVLAFLAFLWVRDVGAYYAAMIEDRNKHFETAPYGTPPRFWHYGIYPRSPDHAIRELPVSPSS